MTRPKLLAGILLLPLAACHHANRVSPAALDRLSQSNAPYLVVFGALSAEARQLSHPTVRVVRQPDRADPENILWAWRANSNGRFFAVLQPPSGVEYVDQFYVEVGDPAIGFDRVLFVRRGPSEPLTGMYVGDFHVSPASNRAIQGQTVKVEVRDDFEATARELKRLYPRFNAPLTKAGFFRNRAPVTPERR